MKKTVEVTFSVEIEVDESKFTPEFLKEFREYYYPFKSIDDHLQHLAQLEVRDLLLPFTEGYGEIENFGIKAKVVGVEYEVSEG